MQPKYSENKHIISPLLCLDIYLEYYQNLRLQLRKEHYLKQLNDSIKTTVSATIKEKVLNEDYDALVVTKPNHEIVWVSDGFTEMTGYPKKYATTKKPSFLQGKQTSTTKKQELKEALTAKRHFEGTLINYRKNGEAYDCHIKILPILNKEQELINFLAFERALKAS